MSRYDFERSDREVLCVANAAEGGASGEGGSSAAVGQGSQGYPHAALRTGHVSTGPLQHLSPALPGHVHLCHLRHVLLHERQGEERTR